MSITWEDGFHERDAAYYAAVGYLCHQYNTLEHFVYGLACDLMGVERGFHGLLFRHLGIQSLQTFLAEYAAAKSPPDVREGIAYANKYVDLCRQNRNLIVHGSPSSDPWTAEPIIRSPADKNRPKTREYPISVEAVRRVCGECETAGWLFIRLQFVLLPDEHKTGFAEVGLGMRALPARPPLPVALASTPHVPPKREDPLQS